MSWLSRPLIVSALCWLSRTALAQAPEPVFIGEVNLITSWKNDASVDRSTVETFKELLRLHGYQTDDCEENSAAWQRIAARAATPDDPARYREIDERLIAAQKCIVPPSATRAYDVKLILAFDAELKSRRAIIHLVALGDYPSIDGGYAHKPGQIMGWYDLMSRAIERALRRYNDPTAVRVVAPTEATVGEVVHVDARGTWDPDGDAFELRWRVGVQGCVGAKGALPRDRRPCPGSRKRGVAQVHHQAGAHDLSRDFRVPMVGDYEIGVYAKIGAREEPLRTYHLRAYPRRRWTIFANQGVVGLPKYFLSDSAKNELGLQTGFGLLRRFIQRVGLFGWFEEAHFGLSLASLQQAATFSYTRGTMAATAFSLEMLARTLDRTGRYGLVNTTTISVLMVNALRGRAERLEWGWMLSTMIGWYYAFGENYLDKSTSYCALLCPSVTIGPTLSALFNVTANKSGLALGGNAVIGIEF